MVTLELALASLGAAAVLVMMAWVLTVLMLLVRCQDVAVGVARQEARGDHSAAATVVAARPAGSRVSIAHQGERVVVDVALDARPWAGWLPSVPLAARAVVIGEPT